MHCFLYSWFSQFSSCAPHLLTILQLLSSTVSTHQQVSSHKIPAEIQWTAPAATIHTACSWQTLSQLRQSWLCSLSYTTGKVPASQLQLLRDCPAQLKAPEYIQNTTKPSQVTRIWFPILRQGANVMQASKYTYTGFPPTIQETQLTGSQYIWEVVIEFPTLSLNIGSVCRLRQVHNLQYYTHKWAGTAALLQLQYLVSTYLHKT